MKTVLVPTDFSEPAKSALKFAAHLCKELGAKLLLFHTYHVQVPVSEGAMANWSLSDMENLAKERLEKEAGEVLLNFGIRPECLVVPGFAHEEIDQIQQEKSVDLVVMGIKHGTAVTDYLFGSTTVSFIRHAHCPVLVIPDGTTYTRPRRMLFACDYDSRTTPKVITPLKEIAEVFSSKVYVFNVVSPGEEFSVKKSVAGIHIDEYLDTVNHIYYFPEEEGVVEGIDRFISKHDVQWVTLVPHQHKWYERLLNTPLTKKYLFHADRPVLVLPERK